MAIYYPPLHPADQEFTRNAATKDNSTRAQQLEVSSKDLISNFPLMTGPTQPQVKAASFDVYSDPLVIYQDFSEFDMDPEEFEDAGLKDAVSGRFQLTLAPDPIHKANYSGGSPNYIKFPDYSIDGEIIGDVKYGYFVSYLRECFRWGGFQGLKGSAKPPVDEINYLTKDLLPI